MNMMSTLNFEHEKKKFQDIKISMNAYEYQKL